MSMSEDRGRLCPLTPLGVDNLGEFLPLERSAMQASSPTQLVTLQGHGRVERTGGIPVFSVCHWVWTTPHRLPEPQVSGDSSAPAGSNSKGHLRHNVPLSAPCRVVQYPP